MKIGIFDSGIGGLTTIAEIMKRIPNADYIYYADNKNAFFGEKSKEQIIGYSRAAVTYFLNKNVDVIVFACNTATAAAIDVIRAENTVTIVGTEPAIKPAAADNAKTVVLATPFTATSDRFLRLNKNANTIIVKAEGLAEEIEEQIISNPIKFDRTINRLLSPYTFKNLVLGCTHFCYLRPNFARLYPEAQIFDGNEGVAKRVLSILSPLQPKNDGRIFFHFTSYNDLDRYVLLLSYAFNSFSQKNLAFRAEML